MVLVAEYYISLILCQKNCQTRFIFLAPKEFLTRFLLNYILSFWHLSLNMLC